MRLIKEQVRQLAAANTSLRREHGTAVTRAEELEDERDALMQEITEVGLGGSCLPRHSSVDYAAASFT